MYSRNEAAQLKKDFWTVFGQYMAPVLSSEGEKVSWGNYKTGEKDIFFRLYVDNKKAAVSIEITHADFELQQIYYEQFLGLKKLFNKALGNDWQWQLHTTDDFAKPVSKIYKELPGVSVFQKEDWPKIISFFKTNIMALDEFWNGAKVSFEMLR